MSIDRCWMLTLISTDSARYPQENTRLAFHGRVVRQNTGASPLPHTMASHEAKSKTCRRGGTEFSLQPFIMNGSSFN